MSLPNCKYCGKFCNPNNEDAISEDVYGFMGIDDTVFYHTKCKEKKLTTEQNPERSVATGDAILTNDDKIKKQTS